MKKKSPLDYSHFILIIFIIFFICIMIFFLFINSIHYIEVTGIIKPLNYQIITPINSGVIKNIYFNDGDYVKVGDLVVEMEDIDYQIQIKNYRIEKEKLILLNERLQKESEIFENRINTNKKIRIRKTEEMHVRKSCGSISEIEYHDTLNKLEIDELNEKFEGIKYNYEVEENIKKIESIENNITHLEMMINKTKIYSKLYGIIIDIDDSVKVGGFFESGIIIQKIYSNNTIYAEVYIPEKNIPKVDLNQKAKIFMTSLPYTKYKVFTGQLEDLKKSSDKSIYIGKIEIFDPFFKIKSINELKTKELMFGMSLKARINVGRESLIKKFLGLD